VDDLAKNSLLVIAISARPYAIAAKKSGFRVFVIDGFADAETIEAAAQTFVCPFDERGFKAVKLRAILKKIDLTPFVGCVFGSGFEAQPQLLEEINRFLPIIGNSASIVAQVKNPEYFFSTLIGLRIPYPNIFNDTPKDLSAQAYLQKSCGGSGGQHIQYPAKKSAFQQGDYYQTLIQGESVSVLFLATKSNKIKVNQAHFNASLIGFNAQWVDATSEQPFRFGGAASGVFLSQSIKNNLYEIVKKLTEALGLVGLNSLDVIIQDETIYVLEVNPRLSATFDLYAKDWRDNFNLDLMALHIQAGLGEPIPSDQQKKLNDAHLQTLQMPAKYSNAMAIVYAEEDLLIYEDFKWPDWTQDRPLIKQLNVNNLLQNKPFSKIPNKFTVRILKGWPICSVFNYSKKGINAEKSGENGNTQVAKKDLIKKIKRLNYFLNSTLN